MAPRNNADGKLRLQVQFTRANCPILFDILSSTDRYYRSKRFLQLALAGVSVEQGTLVVGEKAASAPTPTAPVIAAARRKKKVVEDVPKPAKPHYAPINEAAGDAMGKMLEEMGG